jgi:hypothetical protein
MEKFIGHPGCCGSFFLGSFPRVLGCLLYHDLLRNNTYMSLVEVDNPLHNVLVVGSCGTLPVLCLIEILLYLILHLCIHLDLLGVHCTWVPGYTAWGYTLDANYYTVVVHCFMVVVHGSNEVPFFLSSFLIAPYKYLKFFISSAPSFYNPYHHDPLICKNCNMKFLVLSYTYASLDNDMDHAHGFYKYRTMVLLSERGLVLLFPCIAQNLDICSYGVLLSCIAYTKKLLFSLFPYSGQVKTLDS